MPPLLSTIHSTLYISTISYPLIVYCHYKDQGILAIYFTSEPAEPKCHPGEKERVRTQFIVENMWFLCQISCVLWHGTAPNRLFPVQSKTKLRKEHFDSVRVRTFGC